MLMVTTLSQGIVFLHDKVKPHEVRGDFQVNNVHLDDEFGAYILGVGL